jgi:predicted transcriptional regulator
MRRFSQRFGRPIVLTRHAVARMGERGVDDEMIVKLIEQGDIKDKDSRRKWIYMAFPERADNLVCAAVVLEEAVVVKTVMVRWRLAEV